MTMTCFFEQNFGEAPSVTQFVPGRVNLIGEHIDYNGGRVLPFALSSGVTVSLTPRADDRFVMVSDRFTDKVSAWADDKVSEGWARYLFYAASLALQLGWIDSGADISVTSTLEDGAGVSSSAAICVATFKAICLLRGIKKDDTEVAKLARRVENDFIGIPCGIMDQMAVAVAQPGEAVFLDTASLDFERIVLPESHRFVVLHSGIRRELADGRYAARAQECRSAKHFFGTEDLCHLSLDDVLSARGLEEPIRRRVRHCITEHTRTMAAVQALKAEDMDAFGALMDESHLSMRDDFEMTVPGIDDLVETCKKKGAIGARLTGGGFGGCVVACVEHDEADRWRTEVLADQPRAFTVA